MNENLWFKIHRPLLLKIVNTDFGRDLLCVPKDYPLIIDMSKRHVTADLGGGKRLSDFRIGAKWGNVIRHRWQEFNSYARYFLSDPGVLVSPLVRSVLAVHATTTTVYPDPSPESTSVDGHTGTDTSNNTFATLRSRAGDFAGDTASSETLDIVAGTTTDRYNSMRRNPTLFDTSALPDTDVISAAVYSLRGTSSVNLLSSDMSICVAVVNTASNTAVVAGDHDLADWTMTDQTDRVAQGSWSTSGYNDFAVNATGLANISKTGITKWGVVTSYDMDNSAPTWSNSLVDRIAYNSADNTGTTTDPKLVITHDAAASISRLLILGVG